MEGLRLVLGSSESNVWQYGLPAVGPIRTSLPWGLGLRDRPLSGALLAVQEGGRMEGLRLVSRQFRKQRLAEWAAGCWLDPHFTAMVFWLCEDRPLSGALLAVQEGGRMEGLRLVS